MRRIIAGTLALTVLSSTWLLAADPAPKAKKAPKKAPPPASAQMQQMQDQLNQQQQQINQLQQQLQQSNQQLQAAQSSMQSSVQKATQDAAAAQQAASAAQQTANSLNSSVTELKTCCTDLTASVTSIKKDIKELLNPLAIRYKGVTITPGGFVDYGVAWRSRNDNTSLSSAFGQMPLDGTANAKINELHMDARNSRIQFRVEGSPNDNVKLTGFIMGDFYGTADPSTNPNQVNSWLFRVREAWVMSQFKSGWVFAGGQMYSLMTPARRGVLPGGEMLPLAYEGNQPVGFPYERGAQLRFGKKFGNMSAAFEIDQPEAANLSSNMTPTSLLGIQNSGSDFPVGNNMPVACCSQAFLVYPGNSQTVAGGVTTTTSGTALAAGTAATVAAPNSALGSSTESINGGFGAMAVPDVVAKLAWDSPTSSAHFEVRGVARWLRAGEALSARGTPINSAINNQASIITTSSMNVASTQAPNSATSSTCLSGNSCLYSGNIDMNYAFGWGVGVAGVAPLTKKVDFIFDAVGGHAPDARMFPSGANSGDWTIGVDSSGTYVVKPVKAASVLAGFEFHPTPKWDAFVYFGDEYYQRYQQCDPYGQLNAGLNGTGAKYAAGVNSQCPSGGFALGYGIPETPSNVVNPSNTTGGNRDVWDGTAGYIYRFYKGSFGTFQTMGEYQYVHRALWQPNNTNALPGTFYKGMYSIVDLAVRYVLP